MRTQRATIAVQAVSASLLLFSNACHQRPSGPSVHYQNGAAIYQDLYVREMDDAYLDPKMDGAVAELKQVDPSSISAHLANDLLAQIDKGRADAKAANATRQKALAISQQPQTIDPNRVILADTAQAMAVPDAGSVADPYGPGASIADINRDAGGCLVAGNEFREEGSDGKTGTSYTLADDPACKTKLPGFSGQMVLAVNGRIYRRVANSEVHADKVLPGSPRFLPDGGIPPTTPAAQALGGPTAPQRPDAASLDTNVARQQDATPRPAPSVGAPRTQTSDAASTNTNVAADQNATPNAPVVQAPAVPMEDATPPPAK